MLRNAWIGLVLCLVTNIVLAEQSGVTHAVVREWNFDGCHFRMSDPYGGRIDIGSYIATINPKARHPFETWIQFSCQNPATSKTFLDLASIRKSSGRWELDTSKENPDLPSMHTTLYRLHGKSWDGAGTTQDQTNGDEEKRGQYFGFCIPHHSVALCGSVDGVTYLTYPSESVLPQIIQLLESIEFIDTPISAPTSSGTTAAPHP